MTEEEGQQEPVLLPKENQQEKRSASEPVLLSEDHKENRTSAPYLLIILIAVALCAAFWKMVVRKSEPTGNNYEQISKEAREAEIRKSQELKKIRARGGR